MRKFTSGLTALALGAGGAVALAVAVPGVASASCAEEILIDTQAELLSTFAPTDTRALGRAELVDGSAHLYTLPEAAGVSPSQRKVTGYYTIAANDNVLLRDQTDPSNYALNGTVNSGTAPGYQLVVDLDGDGTRDAILVNESRGPGSGYGTNWWLTSPRTGFTLNGQQPKVSGGGNNDANGDLDDWVKAYPNTEILGFGYSLGSGVDGDFSLTSLDFGCNTFVFDLAQVAPANQAPDAELTATAPDANGNVTFTSQSSDDSGVYTQHLDYGDGTSVDGGPNDNGPITHQYAPGTYTAILTVTDAQGLKDTDEVTFTIAAPPAPTDTVNGDNPLAGTGANVMGLAGLGFLAVAGAGTGLVINRRRRASSDV